MGDQRKKLELLAASAEVFTPGSPVDSYELFSGRLSLIQDMINVIAQRGQHVALYGERGVGKTSLANILGLIRVPHSGKAKPITVRVNCSSRDSFRTVWESVFRRLRLLDDHPAEHLSPERICEALEGLPTRTIIVIDELDRLDDDEGLSLLSDTIKALSDHAVPTTLILVGVADSIDALIGDHRSVERALRQVKMPRMSRPELSEIVDKGMSRLALNIDAGSRDRIARLSEGLPYYTHALALYASQRAIADDRTAVGAGDVEHAVTEVVSKSQQSILSDYNRATRSPRRDVLFEQVLLACALARKNELGYFTANAVRRPMSRIMGEDYSIPAFARHLDHFSSEKRGSVLQKDGEKRRFFYRFANPILQPYVILTGLSKGLITDAMLEELQGVEEPSSAPERFGES